MKKLWHVWCKAMGSKAYDNNKKDDYIHNTLRTFWVLLHILTCLAIILNAIQNHGKELIFL
tara:strand:- start:179 stop:361 length:183 start_codon:yes stop_codon:yes gene_type:complete